MTLTQPYTVYERVPDELLERRPPRPSKDQQLLAEIESVFRRFMYYPHEHAFTVATLLVAHTHLRDGDGNFLPRVTPRGYTGSLKRNCGKTMDLELKTKMSYNGKIELEPTEPGVISMIHNDKRTVGLTEIDLLFGNRGTARSGLRAIINGGYKRGAERSRERGDETESRNVHGPMFLDGKNLRRFLQEDGPFDTIRSRSIVFALERKPDHVDLEEYDEERHDARLASISKRMALWGQRNGRTVVSLDVDPLLNTAGLHNRDREIWRVLFQVAAYVGGTWIDRVIAAARALALGKWGEDDTPQLSPAEELLRAAQGAYAPGEAFLPTRELCRRLLRVEGWWRAEWRNPRAASMSLADELATFGIEATREYVDGRQERGYALVDLLDTPEDDPEPEVEVTDPADWDWSEIE